MSRRTFKQNRNSAGADFLRSTVNDFSVYDYSHSSKGLCVNKITHLGKNLMDEQDWYEKDLSDFDDLQISDENFGVEQHRIRLKQQQPHLKINNNYHAKDYPFDLWYLIAMYIAPEDIGRFALICQTTNRVVNTKGLWLSLFKKYNKIEAKRISRILSREHFSIVRTYVIKSLYQIYPLFQERLNKTDAIQKDPHFLLSSRCVRIWYSKRTTQRESYNYYFEFRFDNNQQSKQQDVQIQAVSPIIQATTQCIIDRDSYILHLVCPNFVLMGPYMGMILSKITLNVSSDYRYHKVKMWFDSSRSSVQNSTFTNPAVTIDPILCLRIYRWYNNPNNLD